MHLAAKRRFFLSDLIASSTNASNSLSQPINKLSKYRARSKFSGAESKVFESFFKALET